MNFELSPKRCLWFLNIVGLGLLFAFWLQSGQTVDFFLLLMLLVLTLLRLRMKGLNFTIVLDALVCMVFSLHWQYAGFALAMPLINGGFLRFYWVGLLFIYLFFHFSPLLAIVLVFSYLCGLFLGLWEKEIEGNRQTQDEILGKYYEMESLQNDLNLATIQVERMSAVAERTRISRDIHDNAGHEIVAAYISFQTLRDLAEIKDGQVLELYDDALARLEKGTQKIREAVHNMAAVTYLGIENFRDICQKFAKCPVELNTYGDTTKLPVYIWNVLETCLKESLTNISRHSNASKVQVNLDVTTYNVRLAVENDGVEQNHASPIGSGLRNLRHRASAIGGNLSVSKTDTFQLICLLPLKSEVQNEIINR